MMVRTGAYACWLSLSLSLSLLLIALIALIALLAAPVGAVEAELKTWDQADVTALVKQLQEEAGKVYDALYREMDISTHAGGGTAYDYHNLKDSLRVFKHEARHLASELEKGKGYDETRPVAERLFGLVDDMNESAMRIYIEHSMLEKIRAARAVLEKLAPYYGQELPPEPIRKQ